MRYSYGKMEAGWIPGHPLAFKKNAVGKIQLYDPVVNAIESVGNAVGDAVNWVVDEVIDPVVDTVGQVVQGMLDNPVKTIAQIAAVATQQYWALPLIEGADVAAKGGDLSDVLEATAKAYVAQELGSAAGKFAGTQTTAATGSQVAGRVIGSATASTTAGIVYGKDPIEAFKRGLVSAGSAELVSQALGVVDKETGGNFAKLQKSTSAADRTLAAVIESSLTAQLTGQDVTAAAIGSAIRASGIATKVVSEFTKDNKNITPAQTALAADIINNLTTVAFAGGNPSAAIQASLMKAGSKALGDIVKKEFTDAIKGIEKAYDTADTKAIAIDKNIAAQTTAADNYNKTVNDLNARVKQQDKLLAAANKAQADYDKNPSQATADAANKAIKAYNDYATKLTADYDKTFKPNLDKYDKQLKTLQTDYDELVEEYNTAQEGIAEKVKPLDTKLEELYASTSEAFVSVMDPNFKVSEYKEVNGLKNLSDAEAYEHWLTDGQFKGLSTNVAAAESQIITEQGRLIGDLAEAKGVSVSQLADKDIANFYSLVDKKYGNDVGALKSAGLQDFFTGNIKTADDLLRESAKEGFVIDVNGTAYGDWAKPPKGTYNLADGMKYATDAEITAGKAILDRSKNGSPVYVTPVDQNKWDPAKGDTVLAPVIVTATRLNDLQQDDPLAFFYTTQSLPENVARKSVGDYLYEFAENTMELAKKTGNSTLINTAGNALKAGGGILSSFNGLVVLANKNPNTTPVGKFAEKLTKLGEATTTKEYQAAVADMKKLMGGGEGIVGTGKAIWGAAKNYPTEFFAEIIGVEGMQEVVPLLVGGAASTAARGLALAKGMGTKVANQIGTRTGLAAAGVSDIAESAGGSAVSAFNDAYATARKTGKSEAEATKIALDVAARSAVVAGVVTGVSLGLGGAALEKSILGDKAKGELTGIIDEIGNRIKTGSKIVVKEGVSEGIEEGLVQAYLEGQLHQLDPTRDVTGNIASSTILGAVAGGSIAGGAYGVHSTGSVISNISLSNPKINEIIDSATSATDLNKKLTNFGVTDNIVRTNLLDTKYDANYTSTAEAKAAFNAREDFNASQADINKLVGATKDADLTKAIETYVDPRVLDRQEIIDAAKLEGVELTEEQIAKYIGQKDEAAAITAARKELDPLGTTYSEAEALFKDTYGYTPTKKEVDRFVKTNLSEADAKTQIGAYVDPRQVTYAEAEQFFKDLGYTPTKKEIESYVGQKLESTVSKDIGTYVDPRFVDKDEAIAAAKAEGYTLTDDELKKYTGQMDEKTGLADLVKYVDPLAVTRTEALDYFAKEGYKPTDKELANYIKQGKETDIAKSISTYADPLAVTRAEAVAALNKLGYTKPTEAEITQFVKQGKEVDILKDLGTYVDTHQVTEAEAKQFFADLGYKPTKEEIAQFVKQGVDIDQAKIKTNLDAYVDPRYVSPEEVTEIYKEKYAWEDILPEDVEKLVGQYDETLLEGKAKDLLSTFQYNATEKNIADTKQELLDKMAEYEKAGLTRDEALEKAIGDVATDLQDVQSDLTTKITETETRLTEDIQTKYDALTTEQKNLADQLTKQGIDLNTAIETAKGELQTDIKTVADLVGKPYRDVTQDDIDFVNNLIQQQTTEPTTSLTPEQLAYDTNQDGIIDQTDLDFLQGVVRGTVEQPFIPPPESIWTQEPTGIYGVLSEQEEAARQRDAAARAEAARLAKVTQQRGNVNTLMQMLGQAPDLGGQQVTVKAPDPTRIGYVYDIAGPSIFATPQQAQMFVSPYAQGGMVEDDVTAELLRILRS